MVLRVLVVVSSDARRGAEVEGTQLAGELTARGHAAQVVALSPSGTDGLALECIGPSRLAPRTLRGLRRLGRRHDVVVAYGSSTLPACAIALIGTRTPFVYRSIGDPAAWVRGRVHRWRTGLLFRRAAAVVALWDDAADSIRRLYRVLPERISVIPNARPDAAPGGAEERVRARRALGLPEGATVAAFVGSLSPEKRPLLAVEAVAALPGAHLLVVGTGPLESEVASACERLLSGRHLRLGVVTPLDDVWAACDVALLTSSTEGMPGVLIEAQLAGRPVVAANVGAVGRVVVDGDTGRLLPADASATSYAGAIDAVVADSARMSSAAVLHAGRFSWPTVVPLWVAALSRCTSPASGPRTGRV